MKAKNGFTLIKIMVVIAIVAVLVSIVVPVIESSTIKTKAAADAANLRTILSMLNVDVVNGEKSVQDIIDTCINPRSNMDPDAILTVVFETPGFIDALYAKDEVYYGLDYLSELAINGPDSILLDTIGTSKPNIPGGIWYSVDP